MHDGTGEWGRDPPWRWAVPSRGEACRSRRRRRTRVGAECERYVAAVGTDANADDGTVELRDEAGERDGGEPRCRVDRWGRFLGMMGGDGGNQLGVGALEQLDRRVAAVDLLTQLGDGEGCALQKERDTTFLGHRRLVDVDLYVLRMKDNNERHSILDFQDHLKTLSGQEIEQNFARGLS